MVSPFYRMMLVDDNGLTYGVSRVGNKPRVSSMPYLYDIAEGNVEDHNVFRILGYNGAVGTTEEDLWSVGGGYVFPAAGQRMEVVSGDAADDGDPVGTGVRTVQIHYLDSSYEEQYETVTLNGITAVPTVADDILRINGMHTVTVGSGGVAAGNIDIINLSDTPIYGRIPVGGNSSLDCIWTVPAGKEAYIVQWTVGSAGGNKDTRFLLKTTSSIEGVLTSGIFQRQDIIIVEDSALSIPFLIPVKIPATADVKISVVSAANAAIATGKIVGWYE